MIERIYCKDYLTFDAFELKFKAGLNVITGVSGAGKSLFFTALLSAFGLKDCEAKLIEVDVNFDFQMDEFGIQSDKINTFKVAKDKSARYFINSQSILKKQIQTIANQHIKYLNSKQSDEFSNDKLLNLLDCLVNSSAHKQNLLEFKEKFECFCEISAQLEKIQNDELKVEELKEFARFEINKIEEISPKIGEYEELMQTKKLLSKKDKIADAWARAQGVFECENAVIEALNLCQKDSAFFDEAMNELRNIKDEMNFDELQNVDIEKILDRIEALSYLNRKYGSIDEALSVLAKKKDELDRYENISFEKNELKKKFDRLNAEITDLATQISVQRKSVLSKLEKIINNFLKDLYMNEISLSINVAKLSNNGFDEIILNHSGVDIKKLSSGEMNRLRLAMIASDFEITNSGDGVILLDEIDANLSGKEAMSIANVLNKLAKFYQIFAISHQPQLSSKANSHFIVEKKFDKSSIRLISDDEKINELARMISGEKITLEAINFAKHLLQ